MRLGISLLHSHCAADCYDIAMETMHGKGWHKLWLECDSSLEVVASTQSGVKCDRLGQMSNRNERHAN